jgi:hypothetical protein
MMKRLVLVVAVLSAAAAPAFAQSAFQAGQKVKPAYGPPAEACTTQDDLKNYKSSAALCAFGDAGGCKTAKDLETRKICGPRDKTFVVISVDQDLMQVSPVKDSSRTYWTGIDDFKPAKQGH